MALLKPNGDTGAVAAIDRGRGAEPVPTKGAALMGTSISKESLPVEVMGAYESRSGQLGAYTVSFETTPAGFAPPRELFVGLPDDACPCPHWGVLLRGEHRITYTDGVVETIQAGEAYFLRPGHWFESVTDSEAVEFSPTDQLQATLAVVQGNMPPND